MTAKSLVKTMVIAASLLMAPGLASAQDTAAGTLTVTASVESSIAMTFENDTAGVALTGAGTNAATMALGNISAYKAVTAGVARTVAATNFTVSSLFGVKVVQANSASATYRLAAALGSADTTNTWKINAVTLTTASQDVGTGLNYGSAVSHTMYLTVPFSATAGAISKVLNFTVTAN